ncbi:MAG: FAD-binding protein [Deferribacteraceae bacterium]|nr:FAD-binding protein [Deferribacteraceae bacterium]
MNIRAYDLLIVGAGAAGLKAAIAAKQANHSLKILVVTKKKLENAGVSAQALSDRGTYHVALEYTKPITPESWRYHSLDIYNTGMKTSRQDLAEILARNGAASFYTLADRGVPFVRKDSAYEQFITDGSVYARACYTGPDTIPLVHKRLLREFCRLKIDYLEHTTVAKLVTEGHAVTGAVIYRAESSTFEGVSFNACILATGGGCGLFADNAVPAAVNGDGYTLAYDAGAALANMEFICFGPVSAATKIRLSGSFFRAIPRLIDENGNEILRKHLPLEIKRDTTYSLIFSKGANWVATNEHISKYIDIAIYKERAAGHKVYMDLMNNPEGFEFDRLPDAVKRTYEAEIRESVGDRRTRAPIYRLRELNPEIVDCFREHGLDLENGAPLELAESAQYFLGGVLIDADARTSMPNLFAAGETAGGQHGANMPGGNAILDTQVFGAIAGRVAAGQAAIAIHSDNRKLEMAIKKQTSEGYDIKINSVVKSKVNKIMQQAFSVVRTKQGMLEAAQQLKELDNSDGLDFEARSVLTLAKLIAMACLRRDESRGSHMLFAREMDSDPRPLSVASGYEKMLLLKKE